MNHIDTVERMFEDAKNLYEDKVIDKPEYLKILKGLNVENALTLGDEALNRKNALKELVEKTITEVSLTA